MGNIGSCCSTDGQTGGWSHSDTANKERKKRTDSRSKSVTTSKSINKSKRGKTKRIKSKRSKSKRGKSKRSKSKRCKSKRCKSKRGKSRR